MKITYFKYIVFFTLALTILFSFNSGFVVAQDDSDLFDEMDEIDDKKDSVKKNSDKDDKKSSNLVTKLWDNLEGSLKLRYHYFPKHADDRVGLDDNLHVGEYLFEFSTWTGNDTIQLHTTVWADAGTQKDAYQGGSKWFQDKEYYRRYFECNELYFLLLMDSFDLTLGKKLFNTGISTLFSPSDRFIPGDAHDPLDPKQFGIWQGKIDFSWNEGTLTLAVIPIYTEKKVPSPGSRWWGSTEATYSGSGSGSSSGDAENRNPDIELENFDYFWKYKKTVDGWDIFVSMNTGPNPYEVVKQEGTNYVRLKNRIVTIAGGFSTTTGSLEIHGESLFNYSESSKDDDYISSVIGITYTIDDWAHYLFMEQIIVTIEYAGEYKVYSQSAKNYTESSDGGRAGENDLYSRIKFKYNEDLKFNFVNNVDFESNSWMNHFEVEYKISEGLTWLLAYQVFAYSGDDEDNDSTDFDTISYREWDDNDRIITSIEYKF
jgi:hypothetical protein